MNPEKMNPKTLILVDFSRVRQLVLATHLLQGDRQDNDADT